MPIHLPPISRREFLRRSLAAGAGLSVAPELFASNGRADANFWALFSDPHVAADRTFIARGVNMADHLEKAAAELAALPMRPAGLLINGDCAYDRGEAGDYGRLVELLGPIRTNGTPIHLTLGNHDNRERFWEVVESEGKAKRLVADKQAALVKGSQANWFVLDSLEKTLSTPGLVGTEQLAWLAQALDANHRKPALVMVHHNPDEKAGTNGLKDTSELFGVIRSRKQVKALFFGHTHRWKIESDSSGIHLVNLPAVAYPFQETEPTGWVVAKLRKDGMNLTLRCIDTSHKAHGQVVELKWRV